jgi:hypothetical protein
LIDEDSQNSQAVQTPIRGAIFTDLRADSPDLPTGVISNARRIPAVTPAHPLHASSQPSSPTSSPPKKRPRVSKGKGKGKGKAKTNTQSKIMSMETGTSPSSYTPDAKKVRQALCAQMPPSKQVVRQLCTVFTLLPGYHDG